MRTIEHHQRDRNMHWGGQRGAFLRSVHQPHQAIAEYDKVHGNVQTQVDNQHNVERIHQSIVREVIQYLPVGIAAKR